MQNKHAPRRTTRVQQMGDVHQCEARNLRVLVARFGAEMVVVEESEIGAGWETRHHHAFSSGKEAVV
jgi:hypothetical protein